MRIILIMVISMAGGSLWAQDFVMHQHRAPQPQSKTPAVVTRHGTEGALQMAARMGNPLQALNPFAPREYADGNEFVYYDENDPGQQPRGHRENPKGIRLFAFVW